MPRAVNFNSAYNLVDLFEKFGDEDRCRLYLEKLRWPCGVACVRCESKKISRIKKRNQYHCDACNHSFSVKAGTIFHDSHLSLVKWFMAIFIISEAKKGISALQLKRTLHVTYKTAWFMCHRIREAVKDVDHAELLSGIVECDETYIGGKGHNMHTDVKRRRGIEGKTGPRTAGKTMVMGAIQRRGDVRLRVGHMPSKEELQTFIRAKIADETEAIMTDQHRSYQGIADQNTRHETVDHFKKEYVRGDVHTNSIENVWSLFKRSIIGSYHQISVAHMDRYIDEFEFRFNNRGNPYLFRDTLLNLLTTSNIEYKQLIGKKDRAA
jgi:transposase-like protein